MPAALFDGQQIWRRKSHSQINEEALLIAKRNFAGGAGDY